MVEAKHKLRQFEMPNPATVTDFSKPIAKAPIQRLYTEPKTMRTTFEAISKAEPAECNRMASIKLASLLRIPEKTPCFGGEVHSVAIQA